jgi:hypothetical protein
MNEKYLISNQHLLQTYLTPEMENYFYQKLKHENKEHIKIKLAELLKFLVMSHNTFGDIPFSGEIDDLWHLWILQTVQYNELMNKLPGNKFIHHCSNDYINPNMQLNVSEKENLNNQISYLVSYVINFGKFTDKTQSFWPTVEILMDSLEMNLDELNQYLLNLGSLI